MRFNPGHPFENGFDLTLRPERLPQPLSWKRPRIVFVNSMSDLFHKKIPVEFIDHVFDTMEVADQHIFQVLTKRSSLMKNYLQRRYGRSAVPRHIWCGVSVEDHIATARIQHLQDGLIHRTSKGLAVRSKSELLIAEALGSGGVDFEYEKPLTLGGQTRYPDFTIEDEISGRTVYWEHLGMLNRVGYRDAWEKKLAWYRANGVLPVDEGEDGEAILVHTIDSTESGFDMSQVKKLITEVCSG